MCKDNEKKLSLCNKHDRVVYTRNFIRNGIFVKQI